MSRREKQTQKKRVEFNRFHRIFLPEPFVMGGASEKKIVIAQRAAFISSHNSFSRNRRPYVCFTFFVMQNYAVLIPVKNTSEK